MSHAAYTSVWVEVTGTDTDTFNLPALIRRHPDRYAAVKLDGCPEWERPRLFLAEHAENRACLGGNVTVHEVRIDWCREDYDALCLLCPEADLTRLVVSQYVRDRLPGPHDVPLPIEEA